MKMKLLGLIVISLLLLLPAAKLSRAAPATSTPNVSHYCQSGTGALLIDDSDTILQSVYEKCRPGDTIGIAAGGNGSVGVQRLCDFTKAIQQASRLTVCVLAPLRPTR